MAQGNPTAPRLTSARGASRELHPHPRGLTSDLCLPSPGNGCVEALPSLPAGQGSALPPEGPGRDRDTEGVCHAGSEICVMLLLLCSDNALRSNPIPQGRRRRDPAEDFQGLEVAGDQLTPAFGLGPDPGPPPTPPSRPHLPSLVLEHTALRSGDVSTQHRKSEPASTLQRQPERPVE